MVSHGLTAFLAPGTNGGAAGVVGSRQVDHREPADRRRAAAHRRGAVLGQPRAAHHHASRVGAAGRGRGAHRYARACASCSSGRDRRASAGAFEEIARDRRRTAAIAIVRTPAKPAARSPRRWRRARIPRERWESYRKLLGEARRHERMTDPLAAQEWKRKLKQMHKAQRKHYKFRA